MTEPTTTDTTEPPEPENPSIDRHDDNPDGPDPETFPRAYVERLRDENARYRQRSGRAEEAMSRLLDATVRSAAGGLLADPADLLSFADADGLLDADGWPDAERITAAAEALIQSKPHLAPRRPRGDIGQGATAPADGVDLAALLRSRA